MNGGCPVLCSNSENGVILKNKSFKVLKNKFLVFVFFEKTLRWF
tara:strand:+ start:161 stop:292 length:132 start_codon:yes stop_codon:yes gene_type:complete